MKAASKLILPLLLAVFAQTAAADPSPERQQALRNLLKHDCGACHGLTLNGGLGPALLPDNLQGKSDEILVQTILEGRKGTAMPPWKPFVSADEARWLVRILRKEKH
ncbi:MAG: c-type cytochrome [Gammaproteobacteria bacterium]